MFREQANSRTVSYLYVMTNLQVWALKLETSNK